MDARLPAARARLVDRRRRDRDRGHGDRNGPYHPAAPPPPLTPTTGTPRHGTDSDSQHAKGTDMTVTMSRRIIATATTPPSTPRLRLEPTGTRRFLLDGGWWPRSTDPVAELPGLVLAIDAVRGPVTRLVLSASGWDSRPRRMRVADRV